MASASSAAALEHLDRFASRSSASASGIFLVASSSAAAAAPFFSGRLLAPRSSAALALGLAEVVRTRYYTPPGMVQRILQQSDPVITSGGGLLRFEGFSACCGVYARLDLLPSALDAERMEPGTANVDFNPPMRAALARLQDGAAARLAVSKQGFELATGDGAAFERRVSLPVRWLKGFVEAQAHQARMRRCFTVSAALAQRFFKELPRVPSRIATYVSLQGGSPRLSAVNSTEAVPAGGLERLRVLASLAHFAEELTLYASGDGATAWQLDTPDSRFLLALSPEPARGFSGEGQVLESLAAGAALTGRLRALLRWQRKLDEDSLAQSLDTTPQQVRAALAQLGSAGLVGFDLAQSAYFHRELPFHLDAVNKMHPRLTGARALSAAGQVETDVPGSTAWVRGKDGDYRVRRDAEGRWHCMCPWTARHGDSRGPCKHILATQISWGIADNAS